MANGFLKRAVQGGIQAGGGIVRANLQKLLMDFEAEKAEQERQQKERALGLQEMMTEAQVADLERKGQPESLSMEDQILQHFIEKGDFDTASRLKFPSAFKDTDKSKIITGKSGGIFRVPPQGELETLREPTDTGAGQLDIGEKSDIYQGILKNMFPFGGFSVEDTAQVNPMFRGMIDLLTGQGQAPAGQQEDPEIAKAREKLESGEWNQAKFDAWLKQWQEQ